MTRVDAGSNGRAAECQAVHAWGRLRNYHRAVGFGATDRFGVLCARDFEPRQISMDFVTSLQYARPEGTGAGLPPGSEAGGRRHTDAGLHGGRADRVVDPKKMVKPYVATLASVLARATPGLHLNRRTIYGWPANTADCGCFFCRPIRPTAIQTNWSGNTSRPTVLEVSGTVRMVPVRINCLPEITLHHLRCSG